jgi:NAD(P)-dependent dehydrogenase (short-subunit alcohol dehydrogenase family)
MADKSIFDLTGKAALVTGGGAGIGRGYCQGLAEFGAKVACCDIIGERADETVESIGKYGNKAIALTGDISKQDDIERVVKATVDELGSIDIVFANAGITETYRIPIHEKPVEDWDHVMEVNLRSVFLLMRVVFPLMMERKGGSFISTSSVAGLWPVTTPMGSAYATSKAGVIMLTKVAARQYADYEIRVNAICPGWHRTMLHSEERKREIDKIIQARVPMKRIGMPEDMKGLAVWLASDASSYVTGQVFVSDGGEIA